MTEQGESFLCASRGSAGYCPICCGWQRLWLDRVACPFLTTLGLTSGYRPARRTTDRAALLLSPQQLKQQRDKLRQYQKRVTQQLERERALARQLLRDGRKE